MIDYNNASDIIGGGYSCIKHDLIKCFGLKGAMYLTILLEKRRYLIKEKHLKPDDYFFCRKKEIKEFSGINEKSQKAICDEFEKLNIISSKLQGLPAKKYYLINNSNLVRLINKGINDRTSKVKSTYQEKSNRPNIINNKKNNTRRNKSFKYNLKDISVENANVTKTLKKGILKQYSMSVRYVYSLWIKLGLKGHIKSRNLISSLNILQKYISKHKLIKVVPAIRVYSEQFKDQYSTFTKKSCFNADIKTFFTGFDKYTKNVVKRNFGIFNMPVLFKECKKGSNYMTSKYSKLPKDSYPLITTNFIKQWNNIYEDKIDSKDIKSLKHIIKFSKLFNDFVKSNINKITPSLVYSYKQFPHHFLENYFKFLQIENNVKLEFLSYYITSNSFRNYLRDMKLME